MSARLPHTEYEAFIAQLVASIPSQARLSNIGSGQGNKRQGLSGVLHQLDVSFIDEAASLRKLVVIECKYLSYRIKLEHLKVLHATLNDLCQNPDLPDVCEGILVTRLPPQKGAAQYARFYGLEIQRIGSFEAYRFRYGNHAVVGIVASAPRVLGSTSSRAFQPCPRCGTVYESTGSKALCDACAAYARAV